MDVYWGWGRGEVAVSIQGKGMKKKKSRSQTPCPRDLKLNEGTRPRNGWRQLSYLLVQVNDQMMAFHVVDLLNLFFFFPKIQHGAR